MKGIRIRQQRLLIAVATKAAKPSMGIGRATIATHMWRVEALTSLESLGRASADRLLLSLLCAEHADIKSGYHVIEPCRPSRSSSSGIGNRSSVLQSSKQGLWLGCD